MKKFITLITFIAFFSLTAEKLLAQGCPPCPQSFNISDSVRCNFADHQKPSSTPGPYTNAQLITACKNSRMSYAIAVTPFGCYPGITYSVISVTGGTLISASGNQFTILFGASGTANVMIAFNIPAGAGSAPCRDTISSNFTLINKPVAAFSFAPQPACFNNPTTINFNSSASVNAVNYFWNFGDGFNSILANPSHAYTAPGSYVVTLIVSNNQSPNGQPACIQCIDSVKHTVVIDNLPGPDITCVASVCAGDTVKYCTGASGCGTYTWTPIGGTVLSGQNTPCVTIIWGSGTPQGSLNLVVSGCPTAYCTSGTTVNIPIIPVTGTIVGPGLVCIGSSSNYSLPSWPGTTYAWTLSGGGILNPYNTNTSTVTVNWGNVPGNFTLTCNYIDSALGCGGIATFPVNVRPTMAISGISALCVGLNSSLNATRPVSIPIAANWVIAPAGATILSGNGTPSVNINWGVAGTYTVTATALIPGNVCAPAVYTVTVYPAPVISSINGADSICANQTNVYSATSNSTGLFFWNVTNGTPTMLGVNNDSVQVAWAGSGPYSISVSQVSNPNNCVSNTLIKNVFPYPTPLLSGAVNVCADAIENYSILNIVGGNFQWSIYPPSFGTIISGQGTANVQIKWHGNNNPGFTNTVHLYYGVCLKDSIAININEPTAATITPSGSMCTGGVTLSTGATGTFSWSCTEHPIVPTPGNTPSISGITQPGHYSVQIQNYNGTGCTVTATYNLPDVGRPNAQISATGPVVYCLPNVPSMTMQAVNGPGYTFQWFLNNVFVGGGNPLPVNTLTTAGTYSYYCIVTQGTCTDTSNIVNVVLMNCPPGPGGACGPAAITITSITGCNPFTLTPAIVAPPGATIIGNPTIYHYEDNTTVNSYTTKTFATLGFKQVKLCVDILLADNVTVCTVCKDTIVPVTAAANFTSNVGCKRIDLFDASATIPAGGISSYNWTVGLNPGNTPVPLPVASFNNNAIPNPVLIVNQSGSYIVSLTIKVGACFITHRDTFAISVPNAAFNLNNSCVGTPVTFSSVFPALSHFWSFGDAATSYTDPTFHSYSAAGTYNVIHIVTDANGCKDTVTKPITIVPAPVCNVAYSGPTTFCLNDSLVLNACLGLTGIQWYNNGSAISGATGITYTALQTGNYHFIATAPGAGSCKVVSDTVVISVVQGPNATISTIGTKCAGSTFIAAVPLCAGCFYQWNVDGSPAGNANQISGITGAAPFTIGTHTIQAIVTNPAGCVDSSTITVVFNNNPNVSITAAPNPPQLCSNNLYTLTATTNASLPSWAWVYNNINTVLSTTNVLLASATGNYTVQVTDGVTGCKAIAIQQILPSPDLLLFPAGCDSLCDTSHLYVPLASLNGNLVGYNIDWYDNAPPYLLPIWNGVSFPLLTLGPGNHNLSVIVTAPNGCVDTSTVYSVYVKPCLKPLAVKDLALKVRQVGPFALLNWTVNQEIDNDYFIAERSDDAVHFSFAGKIYSRGNSAVQQSYTLKDPIRKYNQYIYYRIRSVDKSGETISSIVKLLPMAVPEESITAVPNLVIDETDILIQSNSFMKTSLVIYSADGKELKAIPVTMQKGANSFRLDMNELPGGLYFVSIVLGERKLSVRIVKR